MILVEIEPEHVHELAAFGRCVLDLVARSRKGYLLVRRDATNQCYIVRVRSHYTGKELTEERPELAEACSATLRKLLRLTTRTITATAG